MIFHNISFYCIIGQMNVALLSKRHLHEKRFHLLHKQIIKNKCFFTFIMRAIVIWKQ